MHFGYDECGNRTSKKWIAKFDEVWLEHQIEYDDRGRKIRVRKYEPPDRLLGINRYRYEQTENRKMFIKRWGPVDKIGVDEHKSITFYDDDDRIERARAYDRDSKDSPWEYRGSTVYLYDDQGRLRRAYAYNETYGHRKGRVPSGGRIYSYSCPWKKSDK